jgi:tetratricopeptide (TPR) repeat protein
MELIDDAKYSEALSRLENLRPELNFEERLVADYWKIKCLAAVNDWQRARNLVDESLAHVDADIPLKVCFELESANLRGAEKNPREAADEIRAILTRWADHFTSGDLFWTYVQAKTDLGNCLVNAGCYSDAIKELEEALSLQDQPLSRYYIHFWLGIANHQLGNLREARNHLEAALLDAESAPKAGLIPYYSARIRCELALIAYKEHRFDDVLRQSELALEVGLKDPELLRVINRLRDLVGQIS